MVQTRNVGICKDYFPYSPALDISLPAI